MKRDFNFYKLNIFKFIVVSIILIEKIFKLINKFIIKAQIKTLFIAIIIIFV